MGKLREQLGPLGLIWANQGFEGANLGLKEAHLQLKGAHLVEISGSNGGDKYQVDPFEFGSPGVWLFHIGPSMPPIGQS